MSRRTVGIVLFNEVGVLDAFGPQAVFTQARPPGVSDDSSCFFEVVTVAEAPEPLCCEHGLKVVPDYAWTEHPELDIILVPGGKGVRRERNNAKLRAWLGEQYQHCEYLLSVCSGALLLADAGLLSGKRATTCRESLNALREGYQDIELLEARRYVQDQRLFTAAGAGAGIDMALQVVSQLYGLDSAAWTAKLIDYVWHLQKEGLLVGSPEL